MKPFVDSSLVCLPTTGTSAMDMPISRRAESNLIFSQLTLTIAKDLKLTKVDIANSNIIALVAT